MHQLGVRIAMNRTAVADVFREIKHRTCLILHPKAQKFGNADVRHFTHAHTYLPFQKQLDWDKMSDTTTILCYNICGEMS